MRTGWTASWPVYKEKGIEITKDNAEDILKEEVGQVFAKVLEDAGVYKCTTEGREAFERFLNTVDFIRVEIKGPAWWRDLLF